MPPKGTTSSTIDDERLSPLEAALIRRVEAAIVAVQEEMKVLRRHSLFATVALWLLTAFSVAALVDRSGGDSMRAAQAASTLTHGAIPSSATTTATADGP